MQGSDGYGRHVYRSPRPRRRAPRRGRKRRRQNRMMATFLCILVAIVGVLWAIPRLQGAAVETDPQPEQALQQPVAQPLDGSAFVLVLDAGHGGDDPGCMTADESVYEKDINRRVLQKLLAKLEGRSEIATVVTLAEGETELSTKARAAVSAAANADLFLSLHINDNASTSVRGFQVYAQPQNSAYHANSLRAAELLVQQVRSNTQLHVIGDTGIYYMFFEDKYNGTPYDASWPIPEYEYSKDTYGVLQYTSCPALLVEQWFITNQNDMALMNNEAGYELMATCLYNTVCEYFGVAP